MFEEFRKPLVILFAKAPVAGHVKTRLTPALTAGQALMLHEALVEETWGRLAQLRGSVDLELHTDEPTDAWPQAEPRRLQTGGDLGNRILHAISEALAKGRPKTMVVGSDTASLPLTLLRTLLDSAADVAFGPSEDGGYYAICCRRIHSGMFDGVRWSTANTLTDTVAAAARCGLTVQVGQPWFDIDTVEDLHRLPEQVQRRVGWERQ